MKFSDILSRFNLKFVLLTYVLISLIYTASKFYNLTDASQTRAARRSVIEPSMMDSIHNRDTFFVAPISQSNIEKDEEDELRKSLFRDYQLALAESKGRLKKLCNPSLFFFTHVLLFFRIK